MELRSSSVYVQEYALRTMWVPHMVLLMPGKPQEFIRNVDDKVSYWSASTNQAVNGEI